MDTRTKYLTWPAIPVKLSYCFSNLANLNVKDLFSVMMPAGSSSFAIAMKSVDRVLSLNISMSVEWYRGGQSVRPLCLDARTSCCFRA
jgi:hypothetical protein